MLFLLLNLPRKIYDPIYNAVFCVIGGDIKFHEGSLGFTMSYVRERFGSSIPVDEDAGSDDSSYKKDLGEEDNFKEEAVKEAEIEEEDGETEDEEFKYGNSEIEVEHEALEDTSQENGTQQDPSEYGSNSAQEAHDESDTKDDDASDRKTKPSIPDISDYSDSQSFSLARLGPDHRWMLASKQVLDEAVEQFIGTRTAGPTTIKTGTHNTTPTPCAEKTT